ncbi:MAG TPA: MFS transporter [Gemmataceae bacterium]|nr:MFS transporter [Gemmataceae bacterium]
MHAEPLPAVKPDNSGRAWYKELNRYHWFVFIVAALGWLFDTMDQQLFNLARAPAIRDLLEAFPTAGSAKLWGGLSTMIFMIGWATGGIIFGILGDRLGRARTMVITILLYSSFTGLSALSLSVYDFSLYRFLTGLGVGGEFAVGVALVAEVMPDRARPHALGWLQALSAVGNISAAFIGMAFGELKTIGAIRSPWRGMFVVGVIPALLAVLVMRRLKEPERWMQAVAAGKVGQQFGSLRELFGVPRWRRNAIVGLLLASAGVIGLWGIVFFCFELIRAVFGEILKAEGLTDAEIEGKLTWWVGLGSLLLNAGAFFGIYAFSRVTAHIGRKPAFAIALVLALVSTAYTFWFLRDFADVFWMVPVMGFCCLSLFGGYAIYFPELFPTRLRSTGTSFCYNVGRYVASVGPLTLGLLASEVFGHYGTVGSWRYAGVTMCACFFLGLAALPFAPETKGQPLPE